MTDKVVARASQALVDLVEILRPNTILEFGSWQGASALRFITESERLGLDCQITCVDTWLGSPEHWDPRNDHPEWGHQNLRLRAGEPRIIETFRSAIAEHGFTNQVRMLRCSTTSAERYLVAKKWNAELTYVDADHSTTAVASDILIASKISPSGLIAGDDWCWPSVQRGILKANRSLGSKILVAEDDFAWILIPAKKNLRARFIARGWKTRSTARVRLFLMAHEFFRLFRKK